MPQKLGTAFMKPSILGRTLAMAALMTISGCSSSSETANEYAATASALFDAGNYPAARLAISKANAARDDVAEQWALQGRIDLALNTPVNAYQAYSRVLDLDATNQEALQIVAEVGYQVGRLRDAESAADRLLVLNPSATRAMLIKGLIVLEKRRLPEAAQYAERILALNSGDEGGIVLNARTMALSGNAEAALQLLRDSRATISPGDAITATMLEIYRNQGTLAQMAPLFEAMIAKTPDNNDLKIDFANALYKGGDMIRARATLTNLITAQPDNAPLLDQISGLWANYDDRPLSRPQLDQIQRNGSLALRIAVARHFLVHGDPAQALTLLQPVAENASAQDMAIARSLYARTLDATGQSARAATIIDAVLKDDTNNADALVLRAQQALRRSDTRSAINDAQIVVRDYPQNEQGYITLAQVLEARSEKWRIRQVYEQAISDLPQNYALVSSFVTFLYRINDKARAMSVSREFTLANPASLRGWNLLSDACGRLNDSACLNAAKTGHDRALRNFSMDERPGASSRRGLFGKL